MAYINTLPFKVCNSSKFPIAVAGEGFFFRHHPVQFSFEMSYPSIFKTSPAGRIFLTDRRLIFIADTPSITDGFETFYFVLTDVTSSRISCNWGHSLHLTLTMNHETEINLKIVFNTKETKAPANMMDYYSMIMDSTAIARKKKGVQERVTLESVIDPVEIEPPAYSPEPTTNEALFGTRDTIRDEVLPPYSV